MDRIFTIPNLFGGGAIYIFLIRQFMVGLPNELLEAGEMDGCGTIRCYLHIVMPVCSPIIGAAIASVCALSKKADFVIMRVVDVVTCIPGILLALVLLAVLGGSVFNMVLTLTIVSVPGFVLHIRAVVLGVVEQDYVKAARISGTKSVKLVLKHILPNAIDPIIVDATMTISGMMLSAAGLSFIGVGVAPPAPEWGAMLNYAQQYMRTAPYMAIFPGLAIALTALSINLVGDGLRDALDPKSTK